MSIVYWASYSIYFRTLTFFSSANPAIYLGGMLSEHKSDIYKLVPQKYLPSTEIIDSYSTNEGIKAAIKIGYPVILKPDIGYKGYGVKKLADETSLRQVSERYKGQKILIQEYLTEPREFSVMYHYIDRDNYGVSSITEKHLPYITGNGVDTIEKLVIEKKNPFLDKPWILTHLSSKRLEILTNGQKLVIDHIGNFARGSQFENLTSLVNDELIESFHLFFKNLSGMYFCRADVKADSFEALCRGDFKLLEINGAKSEPIHIYDTSMHLTDIIKATHNHWNILFKVVKKHRNDAVEHPSSMEGIKSYRTLKKLVN
jgi:hypothetical protein